MVKVWYGCYHEEDEKTVRGRISIGDLFDIYKDTRNHKVTPE